MSCRLFAWIATALLALPAHAQLRLPGLGVPALPGALDRLAPAAPTLAPLSSGPLQELRRRTVRELLREHADVVEADPSGEPVRRAELLLVSPAEATLRAALAQGFVVLRDTVLDALGERSVVLRPPPGWATAEALARLRALDADLEVDFNHLYTRSGEPGVPTPGSGAARRVGLIDSGIDPSHPALRGATPLAWGCAGARHPSAHGTAVASLLVGRDREFAGALPGAMLYAADIYCDQPDGGSVEAVAQALAWLASERVGVINISLVGPPNRLLERAVRTLAGRGHLIVAAVGNDGPAAPPLYPAAYPDVVGVTGVNGARQALPEAAQGPQVMFAAPGADLAVARAGRRDYGLARGTSFAAPLVAAALAEALPEPDPAAARRALQALAARALDLGEPGRDPVYGWGLVLEPGRAAARNGKQM